MPGGRDAAGLDAVVLPPGAVALGLSLRPPSPLTLERLPAVLPEGRVGSPTAVLPANSCASNSVSEETARFDAEDAPRTGIGVERVVDPSVVAYPVAAPANSDDAEAMAGVEDALRKAARSASL